jgi:hypothetical protein
MMTPTAREHLRTVALFLVSHGYQWLKRNHQRDPRVMAMLTAARTALVAGLGEETP